MTGFAALDLAGGGSIRAWELRSVNGKGLDLRLRLPDRLGRMESTLRDRLKARLARGSVTLNLRLTRETASGSLSVSEPALLGALAAIAHVERAAMAEGLHMTSARPTDILSMQGVLSSDGAEAALPGDDLLLAEFDALVTAFLTSRAAEGAALADTLKSQIAQMRPLIASAAAMAAARTDTAANRLRDNVAKLLATSEAIDPDRIAQELAVLAVKTDVTEEIDRLRAHIDAAEALITTDGPIGRRFDFLMQEFNREANTLCSKSGDGALTQVGLDLKVLIDQMREQVQNVE
jgi:uncharacterized protein (TIGR00255 family)